MKYTVKTTAGITFLFRSVSELEYNAEKSSLFVQLPGMKFTAHGVTSIKGEEDDEPWMNSFNIIGGGSGDGGFELPREAAVPMELVKAHGDEVSRLFDRVSVASKEFSAAVISTIRNANKRGIPLQ